jgi:inorganic phosphate transporter, PiT family
MIWVVLAAVVFLSYTNGANDNFKGVATIYGSRSASYRRALTWATVTQLAGSLLATTVAAGLIKTFSAKGLVSDAIATSPSFLVAAAAAAAATVLLATMFGLPISTTHALTGGLIGAGLVAVGLSGVHFAVLGKSFLLPLVLSPVLAMAITMALHPLARVARRATGIERETCVCVGKEFVPLAVAGGASAAASVAVTATVGTTRECAERYRGSLVGVSAQRLLDGLHFASAGAICFARGLNDTPKILALALTAKAVGAPFGVVLVGATMAVGGVINARKVAETMANKITPLNAGQGFVANLTTAALVIAASRAGLPVSTTHVATSGIFGIGVVNRTARARVIAGILTAWVTTLPLAAVLGAVAYLFVRS